MQADWQVIITHAQFLVSKAQHIVQTDPHLVTDQMSLSPRRTGSTCLMMRGTKS